MSSNKMIGGKVTMDALSVEKLWNEKCLTSYFDEGQHTYGISDSKEVEMNTISVNGIKYEQTGENHLIRQEKTGGYNVNLYFSSESEEIIPKVQDILIEEYMKGIKQR